MNDVAAGLPAATFQAFYETGYGLWVSRVGVLLNGDRDAAADIVQDTMEELWKKWRRAGDQEAPWPGIVNPGGWVRIACERKVWKHRHRDRPVPAEFDESARPMWAMPYPDPAEILLSQERLNELARQLEPEELAIFTQLASGHTISSIADTRARAAYLRRTVRQARVRLTSDPADKPNPGETEDLLACCRLLLPRLSDRQHQIAVLALDGLRPAEIARTLRTSANNVRVTLHNAVTVFAHELAVAEPEIVAAIHIRRTAARWIRSPDRVDRALTAVDQVLSDAATAVRTAEALVTDIGTDEAAAIAFRALGLAAKDDGHLRKAEAQLRRSIRVADRAGLPYRAAEARMSLVVMLADRGETEDALAESAAAAEVLEGTDLARLRVNLGLVLGRIGRIWEALEALDQSQPVLAAAGDTRWEAMALNLRGVIHSYCGQHDTALTDLDRADELAASGGYLLLNATVKANLGWIARLTGDIPAALAGIDAAEAIYARHGKDSGHLGIDRAEVLLAAGLTGEARRVVAAAIADRENKGFRYSLAEAHLTYARAALADGDPASAQREARAARGMFVRQRRPQWADRASSVEIAARFANGERNSKLQGQAAAMADRLAATGQDTASHEIRVLAGRIATDLGRSDEARRLLAQVARYRTRGNAESRAIAWHAHALCALSEGKVAAAERALAAGLRVHAQNNAVLGATELRSHVAGRGQESAVLGLRLAVDRGDARAVLRWAETWRAASLQIRPVRPPDDPQLAADLSELRRVTAEIAEVAAPDRAQGVTSTYLSRLNAQRLRLEAAVRDRSRYTRGTYAPEPPFSHSELASALGERVLVEFVRVNDDLHLVSVVDGKVRRHRLGSYAAVSRQLNVLRFAMNRMSRRFGSATMQAAAVQAYDHTRNLLDSLLFDTVRAVVGPASDQRPEQARHLVIVPTGTLHSLPWTALPTCTGRPVAVTPSARLWISAARRVEAEENQPLSPTRRISLISGPALYHAEPEIKALSQLYPEATILVGEQATAASTAAALDGAHLAHFATHGRFRSDHPMFSSLDTSDGPLYVYDLERLSAAPQVLVLSACESALSGVHPGDELMGVASAVLALGTRTLIASVTPVDDDETRTLMLALHRGLIAGRPPAAALTEAVDQTGCGGWVCIGFGG